MIYISREYTQLVIENFFSEFRFPRDRLLNYEIFDYYRHKDCFNTWQKSVFETYLKVIDITYEGNGIFRFDNQPQNYYDAKNKKTLWQMSLEDNPVEVLEKMPDGWKMLKGAMTQPLGCVWVSNVKSLFAKDESGNRVYEHALLIVDRELYEMSNERRLKRKEKEFLK